LIVGFFSDIHANLDALAMVLEYLRKLGVGALYCGGDIVGYGACPNECLHVVRFAEGDKRVSKKQVLEYLSSTDVSDPERLVAFLAATTTVTVKGNHDHVSITPGAEYLFNSFAARAILWTREVINRENVDYISALPMVIDAGEDGQPMRHKKSKNVLFRLVHASPHEPERWHYLLNRREIERAFNALDVGFCFIGHSHQPVIFEQHEDGYVEVITEEEHVPSIFRRYIINMGSVGQSRDGNPKSCCATLEFTPGFRNLMIRLHRVAYDIPRAAERIISAGLPEELGGRLLHGI
jgi:diadenosine tetraphosphatase ApaH/serine/threonine PP2A family protein phosphatase